MHCSRKRLLRRGLEFHVCTLNKSAHTKKSGNLFNDPHAFTYTYTICHPHIHIHTQKYATITYSNTRTHPHTQSHTLTIIRKDSYKILTVLDCFFFSIFSHVSPTAWLQKLDSYKTPAEKARWERHNDSSLNCILENPSCMAINLLSHHLSM